MNEANQNIPMWVVDLHRRLILELLLRHDTNVDQQTDSLTHMCAKRGDTLGLTILNRFNQIILKEP